MAKILIIEDDTLVIKIYTTRLTAEGHEVISTDEPERAVELASQQKPSLIILDLMMPKIFGTDLLEKLKENSNTKNIPVVIFSNLNDPSEIERAQKLGIKEFISKTDFTPNQVVEKIKQYLN